MPLALRVLPARPNGRATPPAAWLAKSDPRPAALCIDKRGVGQNNQAAFPSSHRLDRAIAPCGKVTGLLRSRCLVAPFLALALLLVSNPRRTIYADPPALSTISGDTDATSDTARSPASDSGRSEERR